MSVIKNLSYVNKNRLKTLKSFMEAEIPISAFPPFPFDALHSMLPYKCKFLPETYVSIKNKKINGLISINKASSKKIKITRLLLEENMGLEGKMLVNYITTLYASKGVETFFMIVNQKDETLLTMLKEGCNFKCRGKERVYEVDIKDFHLAHNVMSFEYIKRLIPSDIPHIKELHSNTLNQYQAPHFDKTERDFRAPIFSEIEQFIIHKKDENKIIAYFSILKLNKSQYMLDFVIENTYEGYLEDILLFTKVKCLKDKNFKTLYIKLKNYYSNYKNLKETLDIDYKNSFETEILIKDFIITAKQPHSLERMIFNDITPAF